MNNCVVSEPGFIAGYYSEIFLTNVSYTNTSVQFYGFELLESNITIIDSYIGNLNKSITTSSLFYADKES